MSMRVTSIKTKVDQRLPTEHRSMLDKSRDLSESILDKSTELSHLEYQVKMSQDNIHCLYEKASERSQVTSRPYKDRYDEMSTPNALDDTRPDMSDIDSRSSPVSVSGIHTFRNSQ